MTADSTVEWGDDRRVRWLDRLLGDRDESGRRKLSGPALSCAVLAAAFMLAAELTPWMVATGGEAYLGQVGGFLLVAYYLGWMVLMGLVGAGMVTRPRTRRVVVAAGLGVAAVLLVVAAGIARLASTGGAFAPQSTPETDLGSGAFFGFAGVVVAALALGLTGWRPGLRAGRRSARDLESDVDDLGPADLTVTPLQ